jgi:hypothetical protein
MLQLQDPTGPVIPCTTTSLNVAPIGMRRGGGDGEVWNEEVN